MPRKQSISLTGGISAERIPTEFVLPPPIEPPTPPAIYRYLEIYGDRSNNLCGLYSIFDNQDESDVWLRFTWGFAYQTVYMGLYLISLVFSEWINDPYYYGDGSGWGTNAVGICLTLANTYGRDYKAEILNASSKINNGNSIHLTDGQGTGIVQGVAIIDLHVTRTGLNANRGGEWTSEIYVNGHNAWNGSHSSFGDANPDHPLGRAGIGGIVFGTQYAAYNGVFKGFGNIKVGTSQGADDIMANVEFDTGAHNETSGTYAPFDDSLDFQDPPGTPMFEILSRSTPLP